MKEKRTECYCCQPYYLELHCPKCGGDNITWSEWEQHIWCYDCLDDIEYPKGVAGPIPIQAAALMGVDYRKYNVETGEIVDSDINKYY
jgi:ribosomal protein S27E